MEALKLKEFLTAVKISLETAFPLQYWVIAEIASLKVNPSSQHCYMDLVEKDNRAVVAKAGSVIWKGRFDYINKKFSEATGQQLKEGFKVLLLVDILFHEIYGLKLNINDIDPSYTIGEFALHRKKILEQLAKEGLLEQNKTIPFPLVPQRIAVISSPSAAGYEDFINTLRCNPYGYLFITKLFSASMQGKQTEKSIIDALKTCLARKEEFDIVIIIRGGGDNVDLHSFDNYNIGRAIARFPLPILTGIGHKRDETVADIVAHTKLISPTAAGEFVIARTKQFEERIEQAAMRLAGRLNIELSRQTTSLETEKKHLKIFTDFFFQKKKQKFITLYENFRNIVAKRVASNEVILTRIPFNLSMSSKSLIKTYITTLERHKDKIELMNPLKIMQRGYSLTFKNGQLVKNTEGITRGDSIETRFYKGSVESTVKEVKERGV